MGFRWFRSKNKEKGDQQLAAEAEMENGTEAEGVEKDLEAVPEQIKLEKEKVDLTNKPIRLDYIQRLYDGIREAKRQSEEIKAEYGQVTSYLKDIQLMDQALEEEKKVLKDTASAIVELTAEWEKRKGRRYKFTDSQRAAMENFEPKVEDDISKLKEFEDYQIKIKHDMRQLDGEKRMLLRDKRDIIRKQSTLQLVSKVLGFMLALFGILLVTILVVFETDIRVPFIATAAFAFVVTLIIVIEAGKNRRDMVLTERRCNRAISFSNRVRIKYVNNTRTIDYMCTKYRVRNVTELEFVYDQYRKAKREWARQREDAFLLNEKNEILLAELTKLGVKDRDLWLGRANAIVDPREMVEVRHELNEQRQKLRAQIDYNNGIMQDFIQELERIRNKKPEYAQEIEDMLKDRDLEG